MEQKELIPKLKEISAAYKDLLNAIDEVKAVPLPEDTYERKVVVPKHFIFGDAIDEDPDLKELYEDEKLNKLQEYAEACEKLAWDIEKGYCTREMFEDDAEYEKFESVDLGFIRKHLTDWSCPNYVDSDAERALKEDEKYKEIKSKHDLFKKVSIGSAVVGIAGCGMALQAGLIGFGALLVAAGVFGSFFLIFRRRKLEESLKNREKEIREQKQAKHNAKVKKFENKELKSYMKDYADWREAYRASLQEEREIKEKLEAERQAIRDKLKAEKVDPARERFNACNDLVTEKYWDAIDELIELLEDGRAETYKEALALYEENEFRKQQLDLQREQEENRQREEARRFAAEERHHREEMRQREELERQRRQAEERRHQEEMRQRNQQEQARRSEEEQQRRKIESDNRARCGACMHRGHCSAAGRDSSACPGFTPRR